MPDENLEARRLIDAMVNAQKNGDDHPSYTVLMQEYRRLRDRGDLSTKHLLKIMNFMAGMMASFIDTLEHRRYAQPGGNVSARGVSVSAVLKGLEETGEPANGEAITQLLKNLPRKKE